MTIVATRSLDAGGPAPLWAPAPHAEAAACGHGVWVETRLDASADELAREVTLWLRDAHRAGATSVETSGDRVLVDVSLADGRCSPRDEAARRFVEGRPWLAAVLVDELDWLRERAARAVAQRDRSCCEVALVRRTDDMMVSYEDLFPADWDLLLPHEGKMYWVADQHCPKPHCPCTTIVAQIYRLDAERTHNAGRLTIEQRDATQRPKATTPVAASLFEPIWRRYGDELVRRNEEVRAAVRLTAIATSPGHARASTPSRSGPCPCGSGRKYKRCCATAASAQGERK